MSNSGTQCEMILAHLRAGNTITGIEALSRFGCARLAARIHDLKNNGHPIKSHTIKTSGGDHVSEYYL